MADLMLPIREDQALLLIHQLPEQSKRILLHNLIEELGDSEFERMVDRNTARLRRMAAEQGRDWDAMDELARTDFFDQLLDE